ncbi:MAG: hypothetical protein JKX92_03435 [Porticoccaceae bacterium]|nr:hypothetical protein [Porticoccaceae bacterium]
MSRGGDIARQTLADSVPLSRHSSGINKCQPHFQCITGTGTIPLRKTQLH